MATRTDGRKIGMVGSFEARATRTWGGQPDGLKLYLFKPGWPIDTFVFVAWEKTVDEKRLMQAAREALAAGLLEDGALKTADETCFWVTKTKLTLPTREFAIFGFPGAGPGQGTLSTTGKEE